MVPYPEHQQTHPIEIYVDEQHQDNTYGDGQEDTQTYIGYRENIDPYKTSFVCLLVPRFEEHTLTGDLSDQLVFWMKDICISFGWQLKFIDLKPGYLHWIMTVSITSFPTQFMKIVRRETSQKIFEDFPKFKRKNVSNEFWAPWYFVGVGEAPYSPSAIRNFIEQIRIEQGLY
jgi:REP element-mobilizing transposase RayT